MLQQRRVGQWSDLARLLLATVIGLFLVVQHAIGAPADDLKSAVVQATGYDRAAVELTTNKVQIVVTIVNSNLVERSGKERDIEATHIASALSEVIKKNPELSSIQAMHIDYVRRRPGTSHSDTVDGIDFRRDAQGNFQHHMT